MPETVGMTDAREIAAMQPGAILTNDARGVVVNSADTAI